MSELRIGNVVLAALCSVMAVWTLNDVGCQKPGSFRCLGSVADGSDGSEAIEALTTYYDAVAPYGWEDAFEEVVAMAICFCVPDSLLAAAA